MNTGLLNSFASMDYSCGAAFCDDPACNTHGAKNADDQLLYWESKKNESGGLTMNTDLLNSFASMAKGSMIVINTIKTAFTKFADEAPTDDEVLAGISEAVSTVILNKDARQMLSFYLIQIYANHLFISDPSSEFGDCMRIARREIDTLLSFSVLDRFAKYVWEHREQFLTIWTVYAENSAAHPESISDILGAALIESIQLLEAA